VCRTSRRARGAAGVVVPVGVPRAATAAAAAAAGGRRTPRRLRFGGGGGARGGGAAAAAAAAAGGGFPHGGGGARASRGRGRPPPARTAPPAGARGRADVALGGPPRRGARRRHGGGRRPRGRRRRGGVGHPAAPLPLLGRGGGRAAAAAAATASAGHGGRRARGARPPGRRPSPPPAPLAAGRHPRHGRVGRPRRRGCAARRGWPLGCPPRDTGARGAAANARGAVASGGRSGGCASAGRPGWGVPAAADGSGGGGRRGCHPPPCAAAPRRRGAGGGRLWRQCRRWRVWSRPPLRRRGATPRRPFRFVFLGAVRVLHGGQGGLLAWRALFLTLRARGCPRNGPLGDGCCARRVASSTWSPSSTQGVDLGSPARRQVYIRLGVAAKLAGRTRHDAVRVPDAAAVLKANQPCVGTCPLVHHVSSLIPSSFALGSTLLRPTSPLYYAQFMRWFRSRRTRRSSLDFCTSRGTGGVKAVQCGDHVLMGAREAREKLVLLSSQFFADVVEEKAGLGQLPIGRFTLSG